MLDHTSEDLVRMSDFRLLDASPFEDFKYTVKTIITMTSIRKGTLMVEAVKSMNASVKDKSRSGGKTSNYYPARLARYSFRISLAGVKHCLQKSLPHLCPNAKASIFKCALEHI